MTDPVLIYTMGKVGTEALKLAVEQAGLCAHKAHNLHGQVLEDRITRARARGHEPVTDLQALDFVRQVLPGARCVRTLVLVRESVGRNISGFFQTLWRHGLNPPYENVTADQLRGLFFSQFNHERPDQWFAQEFRRSVGEDPLQGEFDPEDGSRRFRSGRFDVLLMQVELGNQRLSELVSEFLGVRVEISRHHEGGAQPYGHLYEAFKQHVRFTPEFLARMMAGRVMQKFYSAAQRAHITDFYLGHTDRLLPLPRHLPAAPQ